MLQLKYCSDYSVWRGIFHLCQDFFYSFVYVFVKSLLILREFPFLCLLRGFSSPDPTIWNGVSALCVKQDDHAGSSSKPRC